MTIATAIKAIMKAKGINQTALGATMGKSQNALSAHINRGERLPVVTIAVLADILGQDVTLTFTDRTSGERLDCKVSPNTHD